MTKKNNKTKFGLKKYINPEYDPDICSVCGVSFKNKNVTHKILKCGDKRTHVCGACYADVCPDFTPLRVQRPERRHVLPCGVGCVECALRVLLGV